MNFVAPIADLILQSQTKSVALQMPDSMLETACDVCNGLAEALSDDVLVYVLGDT